MNKDTKIVVTVFTTILTISMGVFIAWKWMDAAEDGHAGLGVAILYLIFILPCSVFIGIFAGLNLVPFLISKKERERVRSSSYKVKGNPFGSKTAPILICRKCNKMNPDSWQWQYCRKCGTSLKNALIFNSETSLKDIEIKPKPKDTEIKPKPKSDDEFGFF